MPSRDARLLPPEVRLVFLSACGSWADDPMRELAAGELSWPRVVETAIAEKAVPVCLRRLRLLGLEALPADALEGLQQLASVQEFRMSVLEDRLRALLERIARRTGNGEIVLLKGAGIALRYFGALADRPMGDLDLLVHEEEAEAVHALALESDWVLPGRGLAPELYDDMHHLLPLDAAGGLGFGLEVHTDLFPDWNPFGFSAVDVWREARPLSAGGLPGRVLVPSLHHQILHTALHFAWSHCFGRGAWKMVRDMDALLADPELDEAALGELAGRVGGASCIYWTLAVLGALTGRPLPGTLVHAVRPSAPSVGRAAFLRHLTRESLAGPERAGTRRLRRTLWSMAIRPGRSGHGTSRPWTGAERWPGVEDPFGLSERARDSWGKRVRGLMGYSAHVLGLSTEQY